VLIFYIFNNKYKIFFIIKVIYIYTLVCSEWYREQNYTRVTRQLTIYYKISVVIAEVYEYNTGFETSNYFSYE